MSSNTPPRMHTVSSTSGGRWRTLKLDMVAAAEAFTDQLQNTEQPGFCPKCLYVFASALRDKACEPVTVNLLKTHHEFWTACARMASAPGATGDLSALRRVFNSNIASCTKKPNHIYASDALGDSVACAMDALCQCLCATVAVGPQKKHKKIFISKNGMWPSSLEQLMPSGVAAYARWACTLPTSRPMALVSRLLVVARRSVMESLVLSPSRDRIIATFVRALRQWRVEDVEFHSIAPSLLAHDVPLGRPTLENASAILFQVFGMLVIFEGGPDGHLDDFNRFAIGYERLLHDAVLSVAANPNFKDETHRSTLVAAASALCSMGDLLPVHPVVEQFRRSPSMHRTATEGFSLGDAVYMYIDLRRNSRVCSGPGCENRVSGGEGGKALQKCGKCKFLHYCSQECQRRDWEKGSHDAPHKIICRALCKLFAAGLLRGDMTMEHFSQAYRAGTYLTDEETMYLAKWALMDNLLPMEFKVGALCMFTRLSREEVMRGIENGNLHVS